MVVLCQKLCLSAGDGRKLSGGRNNTCVASTEESRKLGGA